MSRRRLAVLGLLVLTAAMPCAADPVQGVVESAGSTSGQAREVYRQALERERRGDAGGALALLWTAAGLDPGNAEIQARLAEALERVGALDAAIDAWRAAVAARGGEVRTSRGLVLALVAAGRSADAITFARAANERAPADVEALVTLGLAQSEQDIDAAMDCFTRVLARAPQHTLARYNLALLLRRVDRLDEAIAELQRVAAVEPRAEVLQALGAAWWHRGDGSRATEALQAAIVADPRRADAHQLLGVVRAASRDWTGAAAALRRALELRPQVPETHVTLSRVLRAAGDAAGANRHAAEGERLRHAAEREQEARVLTSLGTLRLEQGDALAALDAFRRAIGRLETYAPAHFQMGRALDRLGEPEAATAAYTRAQTLNPQLVPPPRPTASPPFGARP
jgi:tetratricopeptide (TPR) repeat protein